MQQVDILLFPVGLVMLPIITIKLYWQEPLGKVQIIFRLGYLLTLAMHSKKMLMVIIRYYEELTQIRCIIMVNRLMVLLVMILTKANNIIMLQPSVFVLLLLIVWPPLGVHIL